MGPVVAVVDAMPLFRQGLVAALIDAGCHVEEPADAIAWAIADAHAVAGTAVGHDPAGAVEQPGTEGHADENAGAQRESASTPSRVMVLRLYGEDEWALLRRLRATAPGVPVVAVLPRPDCAAYAVALDDGAAGALAQDAPGAEEERS